MSDTLKNLTKARKQEVETRSFLEVLPKRLGGVEKASLPLKNSIKVSASIRAKAETAATTYGLVATSPSAQPLIGTKRSEHISAALNFPTPLYTLFL